MDICLNFALRLVELGKVQCVLTQQLTITSTTEICFAVLMKEIVETLFINKMITEIAQALHIFAPQAAHLGTLVVGQAIVYFCKH